MRLLLLLNENPAGAHDDVYRAIKNCQTQGLIADNFIYPFLARLAEGKKQKEVSKEIIEIAQNYHPELILWMHTDKYKVNQDAINGLQSLNSKPIMGYWDGDLYQSTYRPAPNAMLELSSSCDVVFIQGFGEMTEKMKKKGCKDIRFVPAFGDNNRFFPIKSDRRREYDIVMIGNNISSRNPLKTTLPGTRLRKEIVYELSKKYQDKFAIFGQNWKGKSAKGVANYLSQHKIYSKSRVAISVNNYKGKYYFSDRLPIAMLSGIPIVHNYEEGFNELFNDCKDIRFFKSIEGAIEHCEELLAKNDDELSEIGKNLYNYANRKLSIEFVFQYIIKVLKEKYNYKNERTPKYRIPNPWLNLKSN